MIANLISLLLNVVLILLTLTIGRPFSDIMIIFNVYYLLIIGLLLIIDFGRFPTSRYNNIFL